MLKTALALLVALCLVLAPADGFLSLRAMVPSSANLVTTSTTTRRSIPSRVTAPQASKGRAFGGVIPRSMRIYGVSDTEPGQDFLDIIEDQEEIDRKVWLKSNHLSSHGNRQ